MALAGDRTVITVTNPSNGEILARYDSLDPRGIEDILSRVSAAGPAWNDLGIGERAAHLRAVANTLREQAVELATLAAREMGKPVAEARAEVEKCAWVCEYYADNSPLFLEDRRVTTDSKASWIGYEAIGVVLAIMPWNFPFWQVLRFAAPTLMAGNTALLKHSPNVTGCALAIEQVFIDAGLPEDVFRTLVIAEPDVPEATAALISDPRIAAVTVTGSERAGAAVASAAGKALKKTVMELGGSDPFVVLADADLDLAVSSAVRGRFINSGQSCLAAKRFIVHRDVAEEFTARFVDEVSALEVGDPLSATSAVGPLARADLVDNLATQVEGSVADGAQIATGGRRLDRPGNWFAPTVLTHVTESMPVMAEETFGPVAAVIVASDDDAAVRVANATAYGLGASVWSRSEEHALRVGKRITSGALFVNAVVASDPRLPFGGTKRSGYGRELGEAGAREFTNERTFVIGAGTLHTGAPTE